jgi:hypothetical protein
MAQTNSSIPEDLVFKPQYPPRIRFSVFLYPVGILSCVFFIIMAAVSSRIFPYLLYAFIFAFTIFSMPMIIFREVRFEDRIILKRYFFPRRIIRYEDVVDLTPRGLVARRGGIPLTNVINRADFDKIIRKLVSQHKIKLGRK